MDASTLLEHDGLSEDLVDLDVYASAPGRVEFIGNHTDYNGGWVLGATIDRRTAVGLSVRGDRQITLESAEGGLPVEVPLHSVEAQSGEEAWANYVLGVLAILRAEGLDVPSGFHLQVGSTLPVGAGLSSSAALELATAFALNEAFDGDFDRKTLARIGRRAENEFVGVPCGLLDQAVVAFGSEDRLVCLDARSEEVSTVPFPPETQIWIFRTPQDHALADADYQDRYDESRAARAKLDELLGGVDHLASVSPEALESVQDQLPEVLFRRARHISTEHRRVQQVVQRLKERDREAVGDLLFGSHESSRVDYENSTPELDFLVGLLAKCDQVLGSRLTGAGFGGAVMAWTRGHFDEAQAEIVAEKYADQFGEELTVLPCQTGPGARVQGDL